MRGQTVGVVFLIAMLSLVAADVSVGCGTGYVHGVVDQKPTPAPQEMDRQLVINGKTFSGVPVSFYNQVRVGDLVRFDGRTWTIEKPANSPQPASSSP